MIQAAKSMTNCAHPFRDRTSKSAVGPGGGGMPAGGEEGYVHVHAGIHGIGDLDASERDWRNPVAMVTIELVP